MNSFFDLERYHDEHAAMFAAHQAALVERRFDDARAALAGYEASLRSHLELEKEEVALPLFEARAGTVPGGTREMFQQTTRRFSRLLAAVTKAVADLDEKTTSARIVAIVEQEWRLKGLVEHHTLRERNVLFPALDRVTTPEERSAIGRSG